VFIIGGGTSLRGFDWSLLYDEKTIGCNQAFRLGEDVCDICVFGDYKFLFKGRGQPYHRNYDALAQFKNPVVTNVSQLQNNTDIPWLKIMPKVNAGLSKDGLGWNCNTGSVAINLALILGAKTVFLLGFDMHLDKKTGKPNWHDEPLIDKPKETIYDRMIRNFALVKQQLPKVFPSSAVVNVNDDSRLNVFPKVSATGFWNERRKNVGNVNAANQQCCGIGRPAVAAGASSNPDSEEGPLVGQAAEE